MLSQSYSKSLKVLTPDKCNFTGKYPKLLFKGCCKDSRPRANSKSTSASQHLDSTVLSESFHVISKIQDAFALSVPMSVSKQTLDTTTVDSHGVFGSKSC